MRPSRVTWVASTISRPAPEYARCPRCTMCQSPMQPSSAEYWHMGEMTMRFGSVMPPTSIGVNSSGRGKLDALVGEGLAQFLRESHGARLVAVQAQRLCEDGYAFSIDARHGALLDHSQRLLHRLPRVLDHAAGLVARRERAVVGIAAVGEHFCGDRDAEPFRLFVILAIGKDVK